MSTLPEPSLPQSARRAALSTGRASSRAAAWLVGLATFALVTLAIAGYYYHRYQMSAIVGEYLRLVVLGPSTLQTGVSAQFNINTSKVTGEAVSMPVEFNLYSPDGKQFWGQKESTDRQGRLQINVPADMSLPSVTTLKVTASHDGNREEMSAALPVEPTQLVTQLSIDKPLYQPGETMFYRSLTLSRFGLNFDREVPIHFEILNPIGTVVANSQTDGTTDHGVGNGAFVIPDDLTDGLYILVARSLDGSFAEEKQKFMIRRYRMPQAKMDISSDDGGIHDAIENNIPINPGKYDVQFFPEGGDLVAGLENRVYFVCRDALGKPAKITGILVKSDGREIAFVETLYNGMGMFSFTPQPGESYRLKIVEPGDIKDEQKLPGLAVVCPIVLTTGRGVFGPDEPLEFNIRATKAGLPLVVGAWCRGVLVGQVELVTKNGKTGMNPVTLPLPDDVGGVIRLTVFNYAINPDQSDTEFPKPLAERLVYRRLDKRLNVRAVDNRENYAPGEKVNISLAVTNEKDEPVAAALGISVVDSALLTLTNDRNPSMPTQFLLTDEITNPEDLENADFYLSDDKSSSVSPSVALDLLLGTQGWRRFTLKTSLKLEKDPGKEQQDKLSAGRGPSGLPLMHDNLSRIREKFKKSLDDYYTDQTQILYTIITISFLAALGLLILVFMMGLLKILRGAAFWLPVLGVFISGTMIAMIIMDPQRLSGENERVVPFLQYPAPAAAPAGKDNLEAKNKASDEKNPQKTDSARSSRRTESTSAPSGQSMKLEQTVARDTASKIEKTKPVATASSKTESFVVRQYAHQHDANPTGGKGDFAEMLFWNPLLITDPNGKASVSFDLSDLKTTFRLQADAQSPGRIGSAQIDISSKPQTNAELKSAEEETNR